jgi:hypothetical protein
VLAFSDIIDFLLRLVRDDDARTQFDRDPQGTLARAGLDGVTGQDIRDARLQLADSGAVSATDGHHASYPAGNDPVREIGYTTAHYTADEHVRHDAADPSGAVDHGSSTTVFSIDDRDTLFFQSISDDDVTLTDNSVSVTDSFNQDNSSVTAIQANNSSDLFNSDDDVVAIQDNDVNSGPDPITVDTGAPADPAVTAPTDPPAAGSTGPDPTPPDPTGPPVAAAENDLPEALPVDDPPEADAPTVNDTPPVDDTPGLDDTPADDAADLVHG